MNLVLAASSPRMLSEFWSHLRVFRFRVEEMANGIEPIHYALAALAALIWWGFMARRH